VIALLARSLLALTYRSVLAGFGFVLPWPQSMVVAWLPIVGKYVPGKVASVAGAIWLLYRNNVPAAVSVTVVFLLNALVVMVGLIIAAPLTLWQPVRDRLPMAWAWCSVLLAGGLVCMHPRVFGWAVGYLSRKLRHQQFLRLPDLRHYVYPIAVMVAQCGLTAAALWLAGRSIMPLSVRWMPLFISSWSLANTIGFMAVFAPGGLGVREGLLLILLAAPLSSSAAIVVVVFRLIQLLVEAVLVLLAACLLKVHLPRQTPQPAVAPAGDALTPSSGAE